MEGKRIGFVSLRLAGSDGVSLETGKWVDVLERMGHECFFMAGELDTPAEKSMLVPECHFVHPRIVEVYQNCFGQSTRAPTVTREIEDIKHALKRSLHEFVSRFDLDLLIPENALTIPLNIPLGLAITEFAVETGLPMIAHHHDFFWERKRFLYNACWDYLRKAFPPHLPKIQHAVLNSSQDHQVSLRTGISTTIIPNVMDFRNPPEPPDSYADDLRERLGLQPGEKFILQPTRVVQRKGIERAIELVHRLGIPARLIISHASGDEGDEYSVRVRDYSELLGVDTIFCEDIVRDERGTLQDGRKLYTLEDMYHQADLVTYCSQVEGFGNAFLETLYYRKPIVVNNYSIYNYDIRPKGFLAVEMDEHVTTNVVQQTVAILEHPEVGARMADHNYRLAERFFSYEVLEQRLSTLLSNCFGSE